MSDIQLLARLVNCTDLHEISVHVYYGGHAPDHVINFETYSCGSATLLVLPTATYGGASEFDFGLNPGLAAPAVDQSAGNMKLKFT